MAETKEKKGFRTGAYAVIAGVIVAVALVVLTIFAFTSRYTAFNPEKVAQAYTDVIIQTGDGYNAYKNTLVSKNQKYGNFVINAYMSPYVNEDAEQNEIIGTGTKEEAEMLDKIYSDMYDYYLELIGEVKDQKAYGFDDYDYIYTNYFKKLAEERKAVIGDDFMNTEFMFGVFEANVDKYGKSLTGTEEKIADDGETVLQEATVGKYQEIYGKDYKLVASVTECKELSADEVKTYAEEYKARIAPLTDAAEEKANAFGLENTTKEKKILFIKKTEEVNTKDNFVNAYEKLDCSGDITGVAECTVDVTLADGTAVTTQKLYVVKIGKSWYVDNTNIDTSALYIANTVK